MHSSASMAVVLQPSGVSGSRFSAVLDIKQPLNDIFYYKAENTEGEAKEQYKCSELSGIGFTRKIPDYEQHKADHKC